MEIPELEVIARHEWQLFGTLTFKGAVPPARRRLCMAFAWLRQLPSQARGDFQSLRWVLRDETGSLGREHYHCLISGLPAHRARSPHWRLAAMHKWEELGGGFARLRAYDHTQAGVAYVLKCISDAAAHSIGKDAYELSRFIKSRELTLSNSLTADTLHNVRAGRVH